MSKQTTIDLASWAAVVLLAAVICLFVSSRAGYALIPSGGYGGDDPPCDTDGDGEGDAEYMCDSDGDGTNDSCYICDTDDDGIADSCEYTCDMDGDGSNDSCYSCDTDSDGNSDACAICDTNDDGVLDSCSYQCDTDGDGTKDACYTCDTDKNGIADSCFTCDSNEDDIMDSCYLCDTNDDGVLDSCSYQCDTDGDGTKDACYTYDSNGNGHDDCCIQSLSDQDDVEECLNLIERPGHTAASNGCSVPAAVVNQMGWNSANNPAGGNHTAFGNGNAGSGLPCDDHDVCYDTCNTGGNHDAYREGCDNDLMDGLDEVCNAAAGEDPAPVVRKCWTIANEWDMVFLLDAGKNAYFDAQANACSCCE